MSEEVPCSCSSGKIQFIGTETCGDCAGTGRDKYSILLSEPCRNSNCYGGQVSYCRWEDCPDCHGSGYLYR